jgi:hypothetical protein
MKVLLLHPSKEADPQTPPPAGQEARVADLGLEDVFAAMAAGDRYLGLVARSVLLAGSNDPGAIVYRQAVLADCVANPVVARRLYDLAAAGIEGERSAWRTMSRDPDRVLSTAVAALERLVPVLRSLRRVAETLGPACRSVGFARFFAMLGTELDEAYLSEVQQHARRLAFRDGVTITSRLSRRGEGTAIQLVRPPGAGWARLRGVRDRRVYSISVSPHDDARSRALGDLRARGINVVANAANQSVDHILGFLRSLQFEVGFLLAALNLRDRLVAIGEPICVPSPRPVGDPALTARGLVDVGLSLRTGTPTVGSDLDADGRSLVLVTGANQGGKSTFLRALGIAQLMMQAGLFVGASEFSADVRDSPLTHFRRREDPTMTSGMLDDELRRFGQLADAITPSALLLLNESFSATNEREGADIAEDILRAVVESGAKVVYVTHSYELARRLHEQRGPKDLFLRAERLPDGRRTYRVVEAEPLPTSHGRDLFERVFGAQSPSDDDVATDGRSGRD